MPVTVDDAPLHAEELGLRTVGQVLSHLKKTNRLVVHVLIDGQEPDLQHLGDIRRSSVEDHTVFIETSDPRDMALAVLKEVESQLAEADRIKNEAASLIQKNQNTRAMEKLSGCLTTWQHAQRSLVGTAQLMKINLDKIVVRGRNLTALAEEFAEQLKQIRQSLENRDFVTLSDLLLYETTDTTQGWRDALRELRRLISAN
jgi:hypothetical protein